MLIHHGLAALSELQEEIDLSFSPGSSEFSWHWSPHKYGHHVLLMTFVEKVVVSLLSWDSEACVSPTRHLSWGLHCCRRWRESEAHPEGSWPRSEFGAKRQRFVLQSKCRMNRAAGDDEDVFNNRKETVLPYWCAVFSGSVLSYPDHPKPIFLWSPSERCPANVKCSGSFLLWP